MPEASPTTATSEGQPVTARGLFSAHVLAGVYTGWLLLLLLTSTSGLFVDEYTAWANTELPLRESVEDRLRNGHLPTYFLLLQGWVGVTGAENWTLRLPSLMAVAAAFWFFRSMARDLAGSWVGDLACYVYLAHQLVIWAAQTARPYALAFFFLSVAAWALWRLLSRGGWGYALVVALAGALSMAFHALFAVALGSFLLSAAAVVRSHRRRGIMAIVALVAPLVAMSLPFAILREEQTNMRGEFAIGFPLDRGLSGIARVFFGDYSFYFDRGIMKYLTLAVIAAAGWLAWPGLRPSKEPAAPPLLLFLGAWLLLPMTILIVAQGFEVYSVLAHERYYTPFLAPMLIMGGAALAGALRQPRPEVRFPALGVLALVYTLPTVGWMTRDGDGPHLLADDLRMEPTATAFYGNELHTLEYELGREGRTFVHLGQEPLEPSRGMLVEAAANHERIWFYIYNNKTDDLEPLYEDPPAPWVVVRRVERLHARAVLLERGAAP